MLDKYTSIIGSGSGFCYSIFEMYQNSTENLQLENEVDTHNLIINLFEGSLELLKESGQDFGKQKSDVVTPKGTTHAGLEMLEQTNYYFDMALFNAYGRAKQMSTELNESILKSNN